VLVRRDTGQKSKVYWKNLGKQLEANMNGIQEKIRENAWKKQEQKIKKVSSLDQAKKNADSVLEVQVCSPECAKQLEEKVGLEYRGNLLDAEAKGKCLACGKKAVARGIMSNAY
jgi:hypothetical protein